VWGWGFERGGGGGFLFFWVFFFWGWVGFCGGGGEEFQEIPKGPKPSSERKNWDREHLKERHTVVVGQETVVPLPTTSMGTVH